MRNAIDYTMRYKILNGRVNFAHYTRQNQLIQRGEIVGRSIYHPNNDASIISNITVGAINTTIAEYESYLQITSPSSPPAPSGLLQSKNNITSEGFQIGGEVEKDMGNNDYTAEFDPNNYQTDFFPGMADFINENIVEGDKALEDRLIASYWDDLGDDVFDDWGYFYIYDVSTGKYYFPLINPQNQDDGVLTTQTFSAFQEGRVYTITHGWAVQGIFKFDISVNDDSAFRFGAYGNMGSDGDEIVENLTYNYTIGSTNLTLYYHRDQESGDDIEQLYSYFIPKLISQNSAQTYNVYYDPDDMSMVSSEVTNGLIVYFSKSNDVKEWVANDLAIN